MHPSVELAVSVETTIMNVPDVGVVVTDVDVVRREDVRDLGDERRLIWSARSAALPRYGDSVVGLVTSDEMFCVASSALPGASVTPCIAGSSKFK